MVLAGDKTSASFLETDSPTWRSHLGSDGWAEILRAWTRRDNKPLRTCVEESLAIELPSAEAADVLSSWRRLSQAIFTGRTEPLLAAMDVGVLGAAPGATLDRDEWDAATACVVDQLVASVRALSEGQRSGGLVLLAVFLYFESLVFWEYSHEYDAILSIASRLDRLAEDAQSEQGSEAPIAMVLTACASMGATFATQFGVEQGTASLAPNCVADQARRTVDGLRSAQALLRRAWIMIGVIEPPADRERLYSLSALLLEDLRLTIPYYDLLSRHVAPAAEAFVANLTGRKRDAEVVTCVEGALAAARTYEASDVGATAVFGSEARSHRLALEAALEQLYAQRSSLLLTDAAVTLVYPFGLPLSPTGDDPVRRSLRANFLGRVDKTRLRLPTLVGAPIRLDDTPQTDAWAPTLGLDQLDHVGVRLLFDEHRLMLRTADGKVASDLNLEVRLGGMGNHYVRVGVSTATDWSFDGGKTWPRDGVEWTPHDLDQLMRRVGDDTGVAQVWLESRTRERTGQPDPEVYCFDHVVSLVVSIVSDLQHFACTLADDEPTVEQVRIPISEGGLRQDQPGVIESFVKRSSQVLVSITAACTVRPGGHRDRIEKADDILKAAGSSTLLAPQRGYSTSMLEWCRYPAAGDSSEVGPGETYRSLERVLLRCNGDTTVLFGPTSPNWLMLETGELVEFAASLSGLYTHRREWLSQALAEDEGESRELTTAVDIGLKHVTGELASEELFDEHWRIRQVELRLTERLGGVQALLDQAQAFMLSRSFHSRTLLDYLCGRNGVNELRGALVSAVNAGGVPQALVRTRAERLASAAAQALNQEQDTRRTQSQRPVELLLSVLAVFGFIDLFAWTNSAWGLDANLWLWAGQLAVLLAVAAVAGYFTRRSHNS